MIAGITASTRRFQSGEGGSGLDFGPIVEGIFVRTFSTGEFLPLQSVLDSNPNVSFAKGVDPETYTLVVQDGGEPGDEITHVGIVHGQFRFLGILAGESRNMSTGTLSGFNTFTSRGEFASDYSASRWFAYSVGGTREFTGVTTDHMTVRPPNSNLRLRRLSLSFQE